MSTGSVKRVSHSMAVTDTPGVPTVQPRERLGLDSLSTFALEIFILVGIYRYTR